MEKTGWKLIGAGLIISILTVMLLPGCKNISLKNGATAHVTKAPFWRSLLPEAYTTISYAPKNGEVGDVVLWQDAFDGPILLISAEDTNVFFCLYDCDVDIRLFRIDTAKSFRSIPPKSGINSILFSSKWEIQYGSESDWREILSYLQNVPPKDFQHNLLRSSFRFRYSTQPGDILTSLAYQGIKSAK